MQKTKGKKMFKLSFKDIREELKNTYMYTVLGHILPSYTHIYPIQTLITLSDFSEMSIPFSLNGQIVELDKLTVP